MSGDSGRELAGEWSQNLETMLGHMELVSRNIDGQFKCRKLGGSERRALRDLSTSITAVCGALLQVCRWPKASAQVVAALLRVLMEGFIAIIAFCRGPSTRAPLFNNFPALLDWRWACADSKHPGSPLVPDAQKVADKQRRAMDTLRPFACQYLNQKNLPKDAQRIQEAIAKGNPKPRWFRQTWFPEQRRELLVAEKMGWLYDVLYERLCSPVHSDAAGGKLFAGMERDDCATFALQFWGAGMYKLVEQYHLRLPAQHEDVIRYCYKALQHGA